DRSGEQDIPSCCGFQRKSKTSTRASKSARVTNAAISYVVRPPISSCLPQKDDGATYRVTPFRLALVFCGAARLTVALFPSGLHAAPLPPPGGLRAAPHASPGDLHGALAAAPSPPSGHQHVTPLAVAPLSLATIEARREPQPITRHPR